MDGDGKDDILTVNDKGQVRVIRKTLSTYHNMGYIVSLPRYGGLDVGAGNLDGNVYGDIAYVNASGALSLMMNDGNQLTETKPYLISGSGGRL